MEASVIVIVYDNIYTGYILILYTITFTHINTISWFFNYMVAQNVLRALGVYRVIQYGVI